MAFIIEIFEGCRRPGLVCIGIAFERKPVVQVLAAARVVHKQRTHAAFDGKPRLPRRDVVSHAILTLTGRVDVEQRRCVAVGQSLHRVFEEVVLHRRAGGADEDIGVERGKQGQFLARFVLAAVRRAVAGEIGILADEARR